MSPATPTLLSPGGTNAVGRILGLLGDEWTLLIIQQALLGATRYGEFMARLPISNSVLANRLRALTDNELLVRTMYQTRPVRAEYLITATRTGLLAGAVVDLGVGTTVGARSCPTSFRKCITRCATTTSRRP